MISKPLCLLLLLCLLLPCVASAAMVEYPQEYYMLQGTQNQILSNGIDIDNIPTTSFSNHWDRSMSYKGGYVIYLELRRHTILLERQNELLVEQNALLRNMTARCG